MAAAESRLWWYRALHHLVWQAIDKHPPGREARVVDAGCGTGGLLRFLNARGYSKLLGFDVSPHAVALCHERGLPVQCSDLRQLDTMCPSESADVIVSNDTLYFFNREEQKHILQLCLRALSPAGMLICNLPTLRAFRGTHDLSVGINHRFTKDEVKELFTSSGFVIEQIRFWPFLLAPLVYARRLGQRMRLKYFEEIEVRSDVDAPPFPLNKIFEMVTRVENALLPWKPFGSSLFVVARKPHN